jgi:hypothetical protein
MAFIYGNKYSLVKILEIRRLIVNEGNPINPFNDSTRN